MPTAILAEDETVLAAELRDDLRRLWPELQIVAQPEDGAQALRAIEDLRPTIAFLDIQMPGLDGLAVARAAAGRCHIVFVTAYGQYAVSAFEQGAVDYLLKPWTPERLATAVTRLRERLHSAPAGLETLVQALAGRSAAPHPYLRWISVAQGRSLVLITCDEILYFQADNKYTQVVTATQQPLINKTIRQLAAELDPDQFLQIHRGTIVNVNAIAAIDRDLRGGMTVRLRKRPEKLAVSASYAHLFRHM